MHRQLPAEEQYPLPPRLITMNVASQLGVAAKMDEQARFTITLAAHYGYGLAAGVIYSACTSSESRHPVIRGICFGLAVWAVSYLGLMPASGLFPIATRQPARRNGLMIAAHVVWGAALGALEHVLRRQRRAWKR